MRIFLMFLTFAVSFIAFAFSLDAMFNGMIAIKGIFSFFMALIVMLTAFGVIDTTIGSEKEGE